MYAAAEGRELVQILLAAGADPTAQDAQHGRTALHTAAMANNVELVRVRCFPSKNMLNVYVSKRKSSFMFCQC